MGEIFLPIADMEVSVFFVLFVGIAGGIVSSMLGIGSGIVNTPMLIMIGIPSFVVIPSQLSNAIGINFSGFIAYWRQRDVDISLAWYILFGGVLGGISELYIISWVTLHSGGIAISKIATVLVLTILSLFTLRQGLKNLNPVINKQEKGAMMRHWMIYFPFHKIFTRSRTEMSILIPLGVGFFTGIMTSSLGGGTAFLITPILTYLIGRTTRVVAGTSLLAACGINICITILHGINYVPADFVLLTILLIGGTIGSLIGVRLSYYIPKAYSGLIGGIVLLMISIKFIYDLHLSGWQRSHQYGHFDTNFVNILANLQVSPERSWMIPIIKIAYNHPVAYTVVGICCVIFLVTIVQMTLYKIHLKWRKD